MAHWGLFLFFWSNPDFIVKETIQRQSSEIHAFSFWLSAIYGSTRCLLHADLWQELHDLAALGDDHWILGCHSLVLGKVS